jgi:hypothetical protein
MNDMIGPMSVDDGWRSGLGVHDATLVHCDRDFRAVADVTDQTADWVVPAGSID